MSSRYDDLGGVFTHYLAVDRLTSTQLWAILLIVSIGDILTTMYGLQVGAVETNPVAATAIAIYGWPALVMLKLVFLGIWWVSLRIVPHQYTRGFLWAGTVYFGAIVLVNLGILGHLQGIW